LLSSAIISSCPKCPRPESNRVMLTDGDVQATTAEELTEMLADEKRFLRTFYLTYQAIQQEHFCGSSPMGNTAEGAHTRVQTSKGPWESERLGQGWDIGIVRIDQLTNLGLRPNSIRRAD